MRLFIVLQQIMKSGESDATAGEITHEVGFEFGQIGRGMERGGLSESERGGSSHNDTKK
jgi:uncharacterized alpha-E superfamily protein